MAVSSIAEILKAVRQDDRFWRILLEESNARSGPSDGGCLICAKALLRAFECGELVRLDTPALNQTEHYGVRIDEVIYDFNGTYRSGREWSTRFAELEQIRDRRMVLAEGLNDEQQETEDATPDDPWAEKRVAALIREYIDGPQFAQRAPLGLFSSLARAVQQAPKKLHGAKANAWRDWLQANASKLGVKVDEIQWSGVLHWLDMQDGPVSSADIQGHLERGFVQVEELVLGTTGLDEGAGFYIEEHRDEWAIFREGEDSPVGGTFRTEADAEVALESMAEEDKPSLYADYTIPGGENYREVLLTLPKRDPDFQGVAQRLYEKDFERLDRAERAKASKVAEQETGNAYTSSHWGTPNVLAHLRLDDRIGPEGEKILFVQEIQSDWGQQGRQDGFEAPSWDLVQEDGYVAGVFASRRAAQEALLDLPGATIRAGHALGVSRGPFVTETQSWVALALKRALILAAEGGYDRIAIISGEQAMNLYDLSQQVKRVVWHAKTGVLAAERLDSAGARDDRPALREEGVTAERLGEFIGKDAARKLMEAPEMRGWRTLEGDDLKLGGKGMRDFYDRIVPQVARKVLKPLGLRTESVALPMVPPAPSTVAPFARQTVNEAFEQGLSEAEALKRVRAVFFDPDARTLRDIETVVRHRYHSEPVEVTTIPMTPALRASLLEHGLPLFRHGTPGGMTFAAAQAAVADAQRHLRVPVTVHATAEAAQAATGIHMESDARGFAVGREIHLVAASHAHPREVQETLWHEVLHVGVTLAYESRTAAPYVQAMTQIASRNANLRNEAARWTAEEGSAFRRRLETQGIEGDALEQAVRLRAIEESLATLSGRAGERIHGLHKLTASVQGWMRSVGLQRVANWAESRTHAEALQMIVGFRRAVSTMMDTAPDDIERALQAPPSGRPHHGKVIGL